MRLLPSPAERRAAARPAAVALALALLAGCSSSDPVERPPAAAPSGSVGAAAATSPVAELQTGLTALLVERTYLVAAATDAVVAGGPQAQAALDALDAASVGVADVLGATYSAARQPLLDALRREDRLLARHAAVLEDPAEAAAVRAELVEAQEELARTVRRVVPGLDAPAVAARLGSVVQAQLPPRTYDRLRATAADAAGTARLLAAGVAADRDLGSPGTGAVRLRADLTGLLTEHVALTVAQARELRAPGPRADSARAALRDNATALAAVLGEAYPDAQAPFLRSWRAHLDRLERYAAAQPRQAGPVVAYPAELARLLASHVEGLPAQSAQTELEPALAAQLAAVDAAAAGRPDAPAALREATAAVLPFAALLSAAMAEDLRLG